MTLQNVFEINKICLTVLRFQIKTYMVLILYSKAAKIFLEIFRLSKLNFERVVNQ